jgi:hypothetical protein
VRNFLIIILIAQIGSIQIFQGGIVGEIFKLRNIIAHFEEHKKFEVELSFIDFIGMHYGNSNSHRGAHEHNKPFPFHKYAGSANNFMAIVPAIERNEKNYQCNQHLIHGIFESVNRILSFNGDVWLPPKLG